MKCQLRVVSAFGRKTGGDGVTPGRLESISAMRVRAVGRHGVADPRTDIVTDELEVVMTQTQNDVAVVLPAIDPLS